MNDEILCGESTMTDLPDENAKETYAVTSDFFEWLDYNHQVYVELQRLEFGAINRLTITPYKFHHAIFASGVKLMLEPVAMQDGEVLTAVARTIDIKDELDEALKSFSHVFQVLERVDLDCIIIRGVLT